MNTKIFTRYFYFAAVIAAAYLALRYALPWLMPFIVALIVASAAEPLVKLLVRRLHIPRTPAACLSVLLVFALVLTLLVLTAGRIAVALLKLAEAAPDIAVRISGKLREIEAGARYYIGTVPEELRPYLETAINVVISRGAELGTEISRSIFSWFSGIATSAPSALFFVFTTLIATFFISVQYKSISPFLIKITPRKFPRAMVRDIITDIKGILLKWLKAELTLSGITFMLLTVLFLIMRLDYALVLALIIALIDLLPVVGAGTVLVPWCIIDFMIGESRQGIILLIGCIIIVIVRNIMEPRLLGRGLGIKPFAALIAMYVGYKAAGILGLILAPIVIVIVKRLNDRGVVHLWR